MKNGKKELCTKYYIGLTLPGKEGISLIGPQSVVIRVDRGVYHGDYLKLFWDQLAPSRLLGKLEKFKTDVPPNVTLLACNYNDP